MSERRLEGLRREWWLVAALASAFVLFLAYDRATARADALAFDVMVQMQAREPDPRILLVSIDSSSLADFGSWPWPRDLQARLVEAVGALKPRAIAYDVLLIEAGDAAEDAKLGRAVAKAPPLFLPILLESPGLNGRRFSATLPVSPIRDAAKGLGHVNLTPDPDGVYRRIRLWQGDPPYIFPHLMQLLADEVGGNGTAAAKSSNQLLIPFTGPPGNFPSIGASAVLRGEVPAELVQDRLVIIGATAEGLADRYPTAHGDGGGVMSGIEIQANLLDGLLSGRMMSEAGFAARAAMALLPSWALLFAFRSMQPRNTVWLLGLLVLSILAAVAGSLMFLHIWIPPGAALAGLAVIYPLWGWRRLAGVSRLMLAQLERLRAEPDIFQAPPTPDRSPDPVSRQALLLEDAVARLQSLRRFVAESLHQLPDAIFVLDEAGKILLANRKADALVASLDLPDSSGIRDILARLRPEEGAQVGWPPPGPDWEGRAWSDDHRHFDIRIAERHLGKDGTGGWLVGIRDDTEVWAARRQREEAMHFLSHDMRSPQASILALLSTAGPAQVDPPVGERIEAYARRTLQLADGFVQLARAEMLQFEGETLNLADLLIDAIDEVWPRAEAKGIKVETTGEDREWLVSGERTLLTRSLINLIDNAVKYSPPGAIVHCELTEAVDAGSRSVSCAIADAGPGIDNDRLCTLFERFKRGAMGGSEGGAGLGLAFVQAAAIRHQGTIRCQSIDGKGSRFIFTVPLLDAAGQH